MTTSQRTIGEWLPFQLAELGVDTVFGMPGVHSLAFYRTLEEAGLRHIGVRHEQGAGFMADGYARACGRPGVAMLISGPGVTNVATALGQAYSDSIPVLALTAAIARDDLGMGLGALHEITDQVATTAPITGLSHMAHSPSQVTGQLRRAYTRFATQRPRPVHLSLPLDVLDIAHGETPVSLPDLSRPGPDRVTVQKIGALIAKAEHPVILAGGGAVGAAESIQELVERTGGLFVSTVAGKGIVPDSHPQSLGATLQRPATRRRIERAELVIAIGTEIAEPDLYVTADNEVQDVAGDPTLIINGTFVRIDIDPDCLSRAPLCNIGLLSDSRLASEAILDTLPQKQPLAPTDVVAGIRAQNSAARSALERSHDAVLASVRAALPEDGLIYSDMTQIGYTGCITFPVERPGCWHFPMGFGTLGYALPASIGGQIACPDRAVVCLVGDGGLQFTLQELATAVQHKLPISIVLWNNDALGEIADFMRARNIPEVDVTPDNPDFETLAQAYGAGYVRPQTQAEITDAVANAFGADGPTLIEVHQDRSWADDI